MGGWDRAVDAANHRWRGRQRSEPGAAIPAQQVGASQWAITASALLPRARAEVWTELEAADHPAWTDPPGTGPRRLEGTPVFGVGAAWAATTPPAPGTTHRIVLYGETTAVSPGYSVTSETLWLQHQYVETLALRDTVDGETLATIRGTFATHAGFFVGVPMLVARLQLIADNYLRRAATWTPGDPHLSSAIPYDPDDPLTG